MNFSCKTRHFYIKVCQRYIFQVEIQALGIDDWYTDAHDEEVNDLVIEKARIRIHYEKLKKQMKGDSAHSRKVKQLISDFYKQQYENGPSLRIMVVFKKSLHNKVHLLITDFCKQDKISDSDPGVKGHEVFKESICVTAYPLNRFTQVVQNASSEEKNGVDGGCLSNYFKPVIHSNSKDNSHVQDTLHGILEKHKQIKKAKKKANGSHAQIKKYLVQNCDEKYNINENVQCNELKEKDSNEIEIIEVDVKANDDNLTKTDSKNEQCDKPGTNDKNLQKGEFNCDLDLVESEEEKSVTTIPADDNEMEDVLGDCFRTEELPIHCNAGDINEDMEMKIKSIKNMKELSRHQLEYLVARNESYLRSIFQGKKYCRRHQDYKKGGTSRVDLTYQVKLGIILDSQQDVVMASLIRMFCKRHHKYIDYIMKVMLPEILIKIYMDIHDMTHSETEHNLATL